MKNVIIVPTNAFVLLKIAGMLNRKLQSWYIDIMQKTFTAYSYIFLFPLGTNKTALDPNDVRVFEVVKRANRSPAETKKDVIPQSSALVVIVLLLLAAQTVF